jgi:hypothetical protein
MAAAKIGCPIISSSALPAPRLFGLSRGLSFFRPPSHPVYFLICFATFVAIEPRYSSSQGTGFAPVTSQRGSDWGQGPGIPQHGRQRIARFGWILTGKRKEPVNQCEPVNRCFRFRGFDWYSRRESNPDFRFRKPLLYPLSYGSRIRKPGGFPRGANLRKEGGMVKVQVQPEQIRTASLILRIGIRWPLRLDGRTAALR